MAHDECSLVKEKLDSDLLIYPIPANLIYVATTKHQNINEYRWHLKCFTGFLKLSEKKNSELTDKIYTTTKIPIPLKIQFFK